MKVSGRAEKVNWSCENACKRNSQGFLQGNYLLDGQMVSEVEDSEYKYLGVLKGGYTLRKIRWKLRLGNSVWEELNWW